MAANLARFICCALPCVLLGALGCSSSSPTETTCNQSSAVRVCASGPVVRGVDVSKYDGNVNWVQAKAAGIQFGFARISDGTANPDAYFSANWQGMLANGVVRGAYQYFRASVDPTAQASLVLSSLQQAGGLRAGDLPVVLDIETADGQAQATIEANMRTWLAAIEAQTGRTPIIYTSVGTYPVTTTAFSMYPLWVANYGASCPSMPAGWSQWRFWQYSSTGTVTGIGSSNVDLDQFNGTLSDLIATGSDSGAALGVDGGGSASVGGIHVADASMIDSADAGIVAEVGAQDAGGSAMGEAGYATGAADASTTADVALGGPCTH